MTSIPSRAWHRVYPVGVSPTIEIPVIRLHDLVGQKAESHRNEKALVWVDAQGRTEFLTYQALWTAVEDLAAWMASLVGIGSASEVPEQPRVLLWLPNVPAFVVAYYAALSNGIIVTAASPALKAEELAAQIADSGPTAVFVLEEDEAAAKEAVEIAGLEECKVWVLSVDGWPIGRTRGEVANTVHLRKPTADLLAREVAVLQYTSGTTGSAKGAVMSQRNLVANSKQNVEWFGWDKEEQIVNLAVLPLCHTWGMCCCLNSTMLVGGTLVLADQRKGFDPEATADMVAAHKATVLYGSATMFHRLMEVSGAAATVRAKKLATLKHVKAGAMLSQGNLKARWDAFCPNAPLRQGYGLTEASPESHNNPPDGYRAGTVGVPIQSTDCRICDPGDPGRVLGVGDVGEVQLAGPQITLGYWRRPEATAAAFAPGAAGDFFGGVPGDRRWLRTGDIAMMDADGYLTIVDRMKDLLKFRGYSISPNAIEECLLRHPVVREAVVVGRNDERDGEVPTAFVVLRESGVPGAEGSAEIGVARSAPVQAMHQSSHAVDRVALLPEVEAVLRGHCEAHLASYERPRAYVAVAAIPKNHVAKPLRRVLRDWVNGVGA